MGVGFYLGFYGFFVVQLIQWNSSNFSINQPNWGIFQIFQKKILKLDTPQAKYLPSKK